jgi:hypothetical protein
VGTHGYSHGTALVLACAAAAARPSAARALLSCAGAYVSGAAGSNECPAGSVRIETEAACHTAAAAAGKNVPIVETWTDYPRGCFHETRSNVAYFNTLVVGAGNPNAQLLCAALATAGAPLKRRRRTDARSACTGARACRHRGCAARNSRAVCVIRGLEFGCAHMYK